MGLIDRFIKTEKRSLENPNIPVSADDFLHIMGWGNYSSAAGITVNTDNALGVPAVWAAVNFISGTLASLPLEVHRRTDLGFELVRNGVGAWLDRAVNTLPRKSKSQAKRGRPKGSTNTTKKSKPTAFQNSS